MKKKGFSVLACIIFLSYVVLLSGCATKNDVVRLKEAGTRGTTKVYPVNADEAWEIAKAVFRWEDSDAIEEHKDQGYMLTSCCVNPVSLWGTLIGVWIEPVDKQNTKVTVVIKQRIPVPTLTEADYHEKFALAINIAKERQALPRNIPD